MSSRPLQQLDYASNQERHRSKGRKPTTIILAMLLTIFHLWYAHDVAWWLSESVGFIGHHGRITSFGETKLAPTVPVHLLAGIAFHIGCDPIGMLLLLAGSTAAGWFGASLIAATLWRDRPIMGRYCWRLWGMLFGWGWVLVPAQMSWIYQWTVVY